MNIYAQLRCARKVRCELNLHYEYTAHVHTHVSHAYSGGKRSVAGWNDGTQTLKADANFWYRVWSEAGCPCTGVLFEIKKKAKHRFKYAVRSLRRQKRSIVRRKLAYKRAHCHSRDFWAEVGRLSKPERRSPPLVVDGVTGDKQIATLWANKLNVLYNTHSTMLRDKIRKTLIESCSPGQLFETSNNY